LGSPPLETTRIDIFRVSTTQAFIIVLIDNPVLENVTVYSYITFMFRLSSCLLIGGCLNGELNISFFSYLVILYRIHSTYNIVFKKMMVVVGGQ